MRRKFKYFGVIPMVLTTFFATSIVTSCTPSEGLKSIEVTSLPTYTEYSVGGSFIRAGLEVTAYYYDDTSKVLTSSEYTITTPDMSTAGTKSVVISYTEDEVTCTTSFNITVYVNSLESIYISSDFTVELGTDFDNLYVPTFGIYEDGSEATLSQSDYTVYSNMSGVMEYVPTLGYVIVQHNDDPSLYDEVKVLKMEAEDATVTGTLTTGAAVTTNPVDCVISSSGGDANTGSVTFEFAVTVAGTYDISANVANSYVFDTRDGDDGYAYDQQNLSLNTVAELYVNGTQVDIEGTATHTLGIDAGYLYQYLGAGGMQLIRLANVPLDVGTNTITIDIISSTLGQTNRWGVSPTINIDYLRIDEATKRTVTGLEVLSAPDTTEYIIGDELDLTGLEATVYFDDGTTGTVLGESFTCDADMTEPGEKTLTLSYEGYTYDHNVTIYAPDSIRIAELEIIVGDDLGNLNLTVMATFNDIEQELRSTAYEVVVKQNGEAVTGRAGFGTYDVEVTTVNKENPLTATQSYEVTIYSYDVYDFEGTNIPTSISTSYGYAYMEFKPTSTSTIVVDFPEITFPTGNYTLSLSAVNMFALNTSGSGGYAYDVQEFKINEVVSVTLNESNVSISDSVVLSEGQYSGMGSWLAETNIETVNLATLTLSESTPLDLSVSFTYDEDQVNRYSDCAIGVVAFYIGPVAQG